MQDYPSSYFALARSWGTDSTSFGSKSHQLAGNFETSQCFVNRIREKAFVTFDRRSLFGRLIALNDVTPPGL